MNRGLDVVLDALADHVRRAVLLRLAHGPATTGQLADLHPISRPAVSRHLRVLQDAGLVRTTTVGRHRWHTLDLDPLPVLEDWLHLVRKIVDAPALHGEGPGVDTAMTASRDGQPRAIPVIRVADLDAALARVAQHGGTVVVEPFTIAGVGRGCYLVDPAGVLVGLHAYESV